MSVLLLFADDVHARDIEEESTVNVTPDKSGYQNSMYGVGNDFNEPQKNEPVFFTDFSVFVREKAAVITWKASVPNTSVFLYRSTNNFSSFISLADAVPIANITDTGIPYIDYPAAGIPYYYAIAEENQLASGNIKFIDGKNTLNAPIEILALGTETDQIKPVYETRPMPLPFLNPLKVEKKKTRFFSSQTESIIGSLTAEKRNYGEFAASSINIKKEPFIFADDKKNPEGGETMELQRILNESFIHKNWQKCEKELNNFLLIKRTSRVTARTRFYLAEALFFQNKYEAALLKFLTSQDMYPVQSAEWIRYCLLALANFSQ